MNLTEARRELISAAPYLSGRVRTAIGAALDAMDRRVCADCKNCSHKTFKTPTGTVDTYQCRRELFPGEYVYLDVKPDDHCGLC